MPTQKKAETKKSEKAVYEFPLERGAYFSTPATRRNGVAEGGHVASIQKKLELDQTGRYDEATRSAVMKWQEENDVKVTGVVDADTWQALFND